MTIYLQRSAPIQPRTSLGKSDVSWPNAGMLVRRRSPRGGSCTMLSCGDHLGSVEDRMRQRSRLDRRRSLQVNSHFAAIFKIYKIFTILRRSNLKMLQKIVKKFRDFKFFFTNF